MGSLHRLIFSKLFAPRDLSMSSKFIWELDLKTLASWLGYKFISTVVFMLKFKTEIGFVLVTKFDDSET